MRTWIVRQPVNIDWHTPWPHNQNDPSGNRHTSHDDDHQLTDCHQAAAVTKASSECNTMHLADCMKIAGFHHQMEHATQQQTPVQKFCSYWATTTSTKYTGMCQIIINTARCQYDQGQS